MESRFRGRALKLGPNISTEQILPARYSTLTKPEDLVPHVFEGIDPLFMSRMKKGDIIVAGANFGCGGSREIAAIAVKLSGLAAIVAESFSRIFYRNAMNIAFPLIEAAGVFPGIAEGAIIEVDLDKGLVRDITKMRNFHSVPYPDFMKTLMQVGGLEEYVRQRVKKTEL